MCVHNLSARDVYMICKCKNLGEWNPIILTKTFHSRNWSLFLQDKLHIVRRDVKPTDKEFLNERLEVKSIYGHKTVFHGLQKKKQFYGGNWWAYKNIQKSLWRKTGIKKCTYMLQREPTLYVILISDLGLISKFLKLQISPIFYNRRLLRFDKAW